MKPTDALQRVARLITILNLARSHTGPKPLGRQAFAEACACHPRTIQRDLEVLDEAGLPLTYDRASQTYQLGSSDWNLPTLPLSAEDTVALALARALLTDPALPQQAAIAAALDKLTAALPPALQALTRDAASAVLPGQAPRDYSHAPLASLVTACARRQSVEIDYQSRSSGRRAWRLVDPYAVESREGRFWELHGWCHTRGAILTFALDQVLGLRETGERFMVRPEWAEFAGASGIIGGLRGGTPVSVEVEFAPAVASYALARRWPAGLSITSLPGGCARLAGTVQGVAGLIPELLRWRRHARVVGGSELRAAMREEVTALSALYGNP